MDRFHFYFKQLFRYDNDDEKTKNETIVFKNVRFLMEIVLKKQSFSKTIVIRFLKVQNDWVVFKNDSFFQKRLTTLQITTILNYHWFPCT